MTVTTRAQAQRIERELRKLAIRGSGNQFAWRMSIELATARQEGDEAYIARVNELITMASNLLHTFLATIHPLIEYGRENGLIE